MTGWYGSVLLGDGAEACRRRFAAAPRRAAEPRASALPWVPGGAKAGPGSANSSASVGPAWGGAWPSHPQPNYQHSPTPQKLAVGCCLFMFAGLLNTDFSRKFGKVTVTSVNLKREPLSFLDAENWIFEVVFRPGNSQYALHSGGSRVGSAREKYLLLCIQKNKPVSFGNEVYILAFLSLRIRLTIALTSHQ